MFLSFLPRRADSVIEVGVGFPRRQDGSVLFVDINLDARRLGNKGRVKYEGWWADPSGGIDTSEIGAPGRA